MLLLLVPAAALMLVLSEPITRIVYQRGEFDAAQTDLVAEALFFFALSLPFAGVNLILIRTFFSLQLPVAADPDRAREPGRERRPRRAPLRADGGRRHHARDRDRVAGDDRRARARAARAARRDRHGAARSTPALRILARRRAAAPRSALGVREALERPRSTACWSRRCSWSAAVGGRAWPPTRPSCWPPRVEEARQIAALVREPARAAPIEEPQPRLSLRRNPWKKSATSRSSPTSTTASRRSPTASSS